MTKNMKSKNFSKLILICAATTVLTGINLEAEATAEAVIKEARERVIKNGMDIEAFNNMAVVGTNAALKGKKNFKPVLRDEQGKIIDAKVVEAKLNARNEAAKGQNVLRSAAEREAERAAQKNAQQNNVLGFMHLVAENKLIQGMTPMHAEVNFFAPILREAPAEQIAEIKKALNAVRDKGNPLKIQGLSRTKPINFLPKLGLSDFLCKYDFSICTIL